MATFDFITDDKFRASLESDYRELNAAMESGLWKSVHILAGSIIEAVLVDSLKAINYQDSNGRDILKMMLGDIISACKSQNILSDTAEDLSNVVREYRNLIHPGKVVRDNIVVDGDRARVAQALVEIIVKEVTKKRAETYGLTAVQIVAKLESDPLAGGYVNHLLKGVKDVEIERLLLDVLPNRCFDLVSEDSSDMILWAFGECFRAAYKDASDTLRKRVAEQFVKILREESQSRVTAYETRFFRADDLEYYDVEDVKLIVDHILSLTERNIDRSNMQFMQGFDKFLTTPKIRYRFINPIIKRVIAYGEIPKVVADCIEWTFYHGNDEPAASIVKYIDPWLNDQNSNLQTIEALQELKNRIEANIIPF